MAVGVGRTRCSAQPPLGPGCSQLLKAVTALPTALGGPLARASPGFSRQAASPPLIFCPLLACVHSHSLCPRLPLIGPQPIPLNRTCEAPTPTVYPIWALGTPPPPMQPPRASGLEDDPFASAPAPSERVPGAQMGNPGVSWREGSPKPRRRPLLPLLSVSRLVSLPASLFSLPEQSP